MSFLLAFLALVISVNLCSGQSIWQKKVDNCHLFKTGHPCRCLGGAIGDAHRKLTCNGFQNAKSLVSALDVVRGQAFYTISISDGNLIPYPEELFKGIETLSLSLNRVNVDQTFRMDKELSLENSLQTLELRSVEGLEHVDWFRAFGGFWTLYQLTIDRSPLPSLPMTTSFAGAHGSYLISFRVTNSNVSCLDDLSMSTFTEVRILDLSHNKLSTIRRESLPLCKREIKEGEKCLKLEVMDLRYNEINHLPDNLFDNFENLNKVFLAGNRLTTLNQGVISYLPKLKHSVFIDLYDNPINCDCLSLQWILNKNDRIKIYGSCEKYPDDSLIEALRTLEKC